MELRCVSLFGLILLSAFAVNYAESDNTIESASGILSTIYDQCLPSLSYACVQKKVLVFVDRLDRVRSFGLANGWEIVKRSKDGSRSVGADEPVPITEDDLMSVGEGRSSDDGSEQVLHDMLDNRIVKFFEHRALKISFPSEIAAVVTGRSDAKVPSMEISLEEDSSEGRLKKKKKLKLKALLLGVLLLGGIKLIKLMPVLLALIKLKAIKAIIFAGISLFITLGASARGLIQRKLALFTSPMNHVKTVEVWLAPMKGGHGDSHGAYSGGSSGGSHGGGGGGSSYSAPSSYSSGGSDSYSSGSSHGSSGGGGGGYADTNSYAVGGGSYNSGGSGGSSYNSAGSGGWSSKSDATPDAHNIAYRAHTV